MPEPQTDTPNRQRLASASTWAAGGFLLRQLIRLGSNLVFTRLLFPEAFGMMAIVNAFRTGLAMFADLGIGPSIVQSKRGDEEVFLDTAWTFQIARGVVLFAIASALAIPISRFYGEPELAGLLLLASLAFLVSGFDSTSLPRMQRRLSIRGIEGIEIAGQMASAATILIWLQISPSVWALASGALVGSLVRLIVSHIVAVRRDRLRWEPAAIREILHFGKWILLSTTITFAADQADRVILGRVANLSDLGVYSIAFMFAVLPAQLLQRMASVVLFPALSRARESRRDLQRVYTRIRSPLLLFGGSMVASLAAAAEPFILALYDPRYSAAGWMLQILAIGSWFRVCDSLGRSALLSLGETRWMTILNTVKLVSVVVGLPLGFAAYGFPGGIAALVLGDFTRWLVCSAVTAQKGIRGVGMDLVATVAVATAAFLGRFVGGSLAEIGTSEALQALGAAAAALLVIGPFSAALLHRVGILSARRSDSH